MERNADALVDIARMTTARQFAQELPAICHLIDPSAMEEDERKRDSKAHLHLSRIGSGMWRMDGLLPDEVGTQFKAVLDAVRRRLRAEEKEAEQGSADAGTPESSAPAESTTDVIGIDVFGSPIHADETPAQAMDFRYTSVQNVDALRLLLTLVVLVSPPPHPPRQLDPHRRCQRRPYVDQHHHRSHMDQSTIPTTQTATT